MKKVTLFIFTAVCILAFAGSAVAYDDLITNDTAVVKETSAICARADLLYLIASKAFDEDGEKYNYDHTHFRIPIKARYGIMEKLEAFVILPFVSRSNDDSESGIGDAWLGVKYSVIEENMLTVRATLDLPLADEEKGLGDADGFGIDVGFLTQKMMDAICINGQVGIRFATEDSDTKWKPGSGIYLDGKASYGISDVLSAQAGLEIIFIGDYELDGEEWKDSGNNWIDLKIGAAYKFIDTMVLKGDIIYTITGANTFADMGILIGVGRSFSF